MKVNCKVKVKNQSGLHARPATLIAKLLQGTHSAVTFTHKKETINARSIMSILMLAVPRNSQILIDVDGDDAEEILARLVKAFDEAFGELSHG